MTMVAVYEETETLLRDEIAHKQQTERARIAAMTPAQREALRQEHHMHCPKCGMDLISLAVEGIKVERCVTCNGTWFDWMSMEMVLEYHRGSLLSRVMGLFEEC